MSSNRPEGGLGSVMDCMLARQSSRCAFIVVRDWLVLQTGHSATSFVSSPSRAPSPTLVEVLQSTDTGFVQRSRRRLFWGPLDPPNTRPSPPNAFGMVAGMEPGLETSVRGRHSGRGGGGGGGGTERGGVTAD